jgi:hypothetical protein
VVNVAVNLDGIPPLWCRCSFTEDPNIHLQSRITSIDGFVENGLSSEDFEEELAVCSHLHDLQAPGLYLRSSEALSPPSCILLRACLVIAKIFSFDSGLTLQEQLAQLGLGGIKIVSCSRIPSGSGMGGSSILAAVILKSLYHLLDPQHTLSEETLVMMVRDFHLLLSDCLS